MSFPEFLLVADDLDGNAFRAALSDEGGAEGKNLENCLGEYSREDLMCFFGQMRSGTVGDVNVPIFANCNRRSPTATGAVVNGHSAVRRRPA